MNRHRQLCQSMQAAYGETLPFPMNHWVPWQTRNAVAEQFRAHSAQQVLVGYFCRTVFQAMPRSHMRLMLPHLLADEHRFRLAGRCATAQSRRTRAWQCNSTSTAGDAHAALGICSAVDHRHNHLRPHHQ